MNSSGWTRSWLDIIAGGQKTGRDLYRMLFLNLFKFKLVHNHGQRSGFERYVRGHHVTLLTVFLSITTIMSAIRNLKVRTPRLSSFKQRSMCFKNYKATPAWPGKRYNLLSFEKIYIYHKLNPKILQYFPQSEAAGVHEAKPGELLIWLQWWKWQEVKYFFGSFVLNLRHR